MLTQLARVEGLRGEFEAGERLIEQAEAIAGASRIARARVDLERGRLRRSSGSIDAALPLFESAFAIALEDGEYFIAADAAHMAALVAPDRDGFVSWTERGMDLAETHDSARHWIGTLLNNLGWKYYDAGEYDSALGAFERALAARSTFPENPSAIALARHGVGKALRSLHRSDEAIPLLEEAVAWADGSGKPDGWFHEELALEYAEVGRVGDSPRARRARASAAERRTPDPHRGSGAFSTPSRSCARELRSALIVTVPEASCAVDEWLESTAEAKPSAGVPAHITIIFPFVLAAASTTRCSRI